MSNYSFIIRSLGLQGIKTLLYDSNGKPLEVNDSGVVVPASNDIAADFSSRMDTGGDSPTTSYFGHPVWANVILKSQDGTIEMNFDTVLCDVSQPRQIIKTQVMGRPGTIKEYISDGDFTVRMRGLVVENSIHNYPRAQVAALLRLLKLQEPIKVISEYLNMFGILNVVVENYNFTQKQGFQNVQPFDLSCVSDTDAALIIKEGN